MYASTPNGTGNKKLYHWLCDRGCRLDVTFHPEFTTRKIAQKIFEVKRDLVDKQHELGLLVKPKVMGDPDSEFAHEIIEMITEVVGPGWEGHIEIVPIYIRGINKIENSIDRVKRARPHVKDYDPIDEDE